MSDITSNIAALTLTVSVKGPLISPENSKEALEAFPLKQYQIDGLFTLPDTDSDTNSDSDCKHNGYIVLCRTCSHCTDSDYDSDPDPDPVIVNVPVFGTDICIWIGIRVLAGHGVGCGLQTQWLHCTYTEHVHIPQTPDPDLEHWLLLYPFLGYIHTRIDI